MLAKRVAELPDGDGWIFEPKWDGFRALVFRDGDELFIQSRDEKPLDALLPELVAPLIAQLPQRCVLDGEIVIAQRRHARLRSAAAAPPSRRVAREAARRRDCRRRSSSSTLCASTIATCARSRFASGARSLEKLLAKVAPPLHLTPATHDRAVAADWFQRFEGAGLDGVMAKPLAGVYEPNKRVMLKVKHERECDCVVAGFRWHKNEQRTIASARSCSGSTTTPARSTTSASPPASPTQKRASSSRCSRPIATNALDEPSVARVGRARPAKATARQRRRARRAAGARARICRGSRCAPSSSSRSPTITCRARASATPRSSVAGAPTSRRGTAPTRSSRSCRPNELSRIFSPLQLTARAIRASDRRRDRASPAAAARPRARGAGSRACASTSTSGRASSRPARRRRRDAPRPRDVAPSSARARRAPRPCSASCATVMSGIFDRAASSAACRLRPPFARDGATRGASPSILRKCGGHGASPSPAASSRAASSSSASSEPGRLVHRARADRRARRSAPAPSARVKSAGSQSGTSSHVERRRHARVGQRAHRVRRAGRAVLGVLVVVEEDAVALLLPPLRRRERRRAPLDLARERQRRAPHLGERPARLDAHVDVHAARAAASSASREAELVEQRLDLERDAPHVVPRHARARDRDRRAARRDGRDRRRAPGADAARCSRG